MDASTRDLIQAAVWLVGIIGTGFTIWKVLSEAARSRAQNQLDMRWRKATLAKDLLDRFYADPVFRDAMVLLDWDGRPFEITPTTRVPIFRSDIVRALRRKTDGSPVDSFDEKNAFIRLRMDRMFEAFDRIGHLTTINVIEHADIRYALEFYVGVLAGEKEVVGAYLNALGFTEALRFFETCDAWRNRLPTFTATSHPPAHAHQKHSTAAVGT